MEKTSRQIAMEWWWGLSSEVKEKLIKKHHLVLKEHNIEKLYERILSEAFNGEEFGSTNTNTTLPIKNEDL
jgi:hypothetical protein